MAFLAAAIPAVVGAAGTLVGGLISSYGQEAQGQAAQAMYNTQAAIARLNTQISNNNADYAITAGNTQATQAGMQTRAVIGQTRAAQGASNIAVSGGSSVDVVGSERQVGDINVANIQNNAAQTAYGYKVQAQADTTQGLLDTTAGSSASLAGAIASTGTLASTAGNVASKWYQMSQAGIPGAAPNTGLGGSTPATDPTYTNYGFNNP